MFPALKGKKSNINIIVGKTKDHTNGLFDLLSMVFGKTLPLFLFKFIIDVYFIVVATYLLYPKQYLPIDKIL